MSLVVVADDAYTFLFAWEFMSLSSWALVMAHDHLRENVRAGYVYIVMASFGTLALLIAFGLLAGADGAYAFSAIRDSHPSAAVAALVLILVLMAPDPRPVSCRCTPGCRSPIPPRQATSPRYCPA
jgi:formate hydrogenlyase subunit 3/multisubunit Na+/H+ antiporter MnhD subunit